ncbi:MAG: hypothetical protein V4486_03050, partial [Patescibacteria group bacterium]
MNLKKVRGRPKSLQPVRDLTQAEIDEKVDRIKDVFKVGMALLPTPAEAEALLVSLALIREAGIQKDAGEEIGVSP